MFYNKWQKIALALTGFFWASCDDSGTEPSPQPKSSSSETTEPQSSSSEFEQIMPAYGIPNELVTCLQNQGETTMTCGDGVTCKEEVNESWVPEFECVDDICPDYGVVKIQEKTYDCDGTVYNEAQFRSRYNKMTVVSDPEQDTTFKDMQPVLYGPPCVFDGTCNDDE